MLSYNNLKIPITFFSLWITTQFSFQYENYVAIFMILSFGILHGSNDLKLIEKEDKKYSFIKAISIYLFVIILSLLCFLNWPKIFLIIFILVSSYHFGEQHLVKKITKHSKLSKLLFISYGLVIFLMLFIIHSKQVIDIIKKITSYKISNSILEYVLITASISLVISYISLKLKGNITIKIVEEVLLFLLFMIIFSNATLIWSFSIYFIIWHSLPSLKDQLHILYGRVTKKSIMAYLKSSFIYWFVSIIGMIVIYYIFSENNYDIYAFCAALLFSITFPHIIIMTKIYK
jgi:beta-carotene 15,15'-dioxygenase